MIDKSITPEDLFFIEIIYVIDKIIKDSLISFNHCNIVLTGGFTAKRLYKLWSEISSPLHSNYSNVRFYFGDERCVNPTSIDSNYKMVIDSLFSGNVPKGNLYRMEAERLDIEAAALEYANIIPERIDLLILSVGNDGHIASLFPYSPALDLKNSLVVPITCNKLPANRLTITPVVINRARYILVMAFGKDKVNVYLNAKKFPDRIHEIPARLVLNGNWFF
jgi:6-phosphogluconolactonase